MLTRVWVTALVLLSACGQRLAPAGGSSRSTTAVSAGGTLPPGVMPATRACKLVVQKPPGFFVQVGQGHLVLTTYANGEPVESKGDISYGMPPGTPLWVFDVHAKPSNAVESGPPVCEQQPHTDFS